MDLLFKIECIETFTQVLEDILNNLYNSNHISVNHIGNVSHIKALKEDIKKVILDTNLKSDKVSELLSAKLYNNEKVRIFIAHLDKRRSQLIKLALIQYNCKFGETLNTFDWKLKLIYGSSELKTFSYPLLQLALYTVSVSHRPVVRLHEINKDMLLKLIGTIEDNVEKSNECEQLSPK